MRHFLILIFTCFGLSSSFGQTDTTNVQVIQFSDGLDNRRAWRAFPPDTTTYRKILMYQTLKCDPALISNPTNSGCGEWDAGANFILYHHDNIDSLNYNLGGNYPDTVALTSNPTYTYYQQKQYFIGYNSTISESNYPVGSGSAPIVNTFNDVNANNKAQYLWTAAELTAAGLSAGTIDKLEIDLTSLGTSLNYLEIKLKHSSMNTLSETAYEIGGFSPVYDLNTTFGATGLNTINLTTPFVWDGISNLVMEFTFSNPVPGIGHVLNGEITAANMAVQSTIDDGYLDFSGNGDYIDIPDVNLDFSSGFSISAWVYYDGYNAWSRIMDCYDDQIKNGFQFSNQGTSNGIRIVAKDNGSGANITASGALTLNQWTHIAATVNGSGAATIYVNGVPAVSGTLAPPSGNVLLSENFVGKSNNPSNGYFDGRMNDIQLWNTALSQTDIQDWMYKDVDPTHPSYADLKFYYKLDDMSGAATADASGNGNDGALGGPPQWKYTKGDELFRNLYASTERPNLGFIQGSYNSYLDSVIFMDSVLTSQRSVLVSNLSMDVPNGGYDHIYVDTLYGWIPGYSYIYDENENLMDSIWNSSDTELYNYYEENNKRIARYITPYGNYLDLGSGFTWVYDLTHLEPWLHDTIDLQGGDSRELIDLRFEFIEGTPPRDVNDIEKVLTSESGTYANIVLSPPTSTVTPDAASNTFGLHYSVTGHGFNNPTNCAEFCARTHYFEVNGTRVYDWVHMKECADNSLYPQGGTWIYDRTGWCPGEAVDWFDLDLTSDVTPGTPVTLTYGVDPDPSGTENGNWSREMFFISYSDPNFNLDAEVHDIISPNSWEYYGRFNPICDNPVIEIRNSGATTLTTAEIEFGVVGGAPQTFTWYGNLAFMQIEKVVLPMHDLSMWQGSSKFYAKVTSANGVADDYADNDQYITSFEAPPMHDADIELNLRTNAAGNETSWDIRDGSNNILYSGSGLSSNTTYDVPVTLPIGCYTLNVYDSGDDGLDFWANSDGIGYCRIKNSVGQIIKTFEPDFGDNIHYQFSVGESVLLESNEGGITFNVFPNPANGEYNIQLKNLEASEARIEIYNTLGSLVYKEQLSQSEWIDSIVRVDISEHPNGIYTLKLITPEGNAMRRLTKN